MWHNMDEPSKNYDKFFKKPVTKVHILDDPVYIKCREYTHP